MGSILNLESLCNNALQAFWLTRITKSVINPRSPRGATLFEGEMKKTLPRKKWKPFNFWLLKNNSRTKQSISISSDIPTNAIYANGEAIPDPDGGYFKYGASV